jgi:ribosomal protein L7/L12
MPTPSRSCRWCGSDHFVDAGPVEWELRSTQNDGYVGRRANGTLVACARCGLVEWFLADPLELCRLPGAREVRLEQTAGVVATPEAVPGEPGWQVVLLHAGPAPIGVIAELRKEFSVDLAAARASVKNLPWVLARTSRREVAESLGEKLGALGAVVRVEPARV